MDKFHRHAAGLDGLPGADHRQLYLAHQAVFPKLSLHQPQGKGGAVDREVDLPKKVGQAADVVLVAVGDEHPPDPLPVPDEVGEVGDDHIHPQKVVVGEGQAAVHHQDVLAALVNGNVLPDLPKAPQGDNLQGGAPGLQLVAAPLQGALYRLRGQGQGAVFHQDLAPAGMLPLAAPLPDRKSVV